MLEAVGSHSEHSKRNLYHPYMKVSLYSGKLFLIILEQLIEVLTNGHHL